MLIDFHTHCFPDKLANRAVSHLGSIVHKEPLTDGTYDDTLRKMQTFGVDRFVCLNIATHPKQQSNVNHFAETLDQKPYSRSFGSIHAAAPDALEELSRLNDLGMKGIKIHPDYQGLEMDDARLMPIYDFCAEQGLLCLFHAGFDPISPDHTRVTPHKSLQIHRKFPKLPMILAHMGGFNQWDEVEASLAGTDIFIDTSLAPHNLSPEQATRIIQKHGAEKVLFGSDCPWESPRLTFEFIDSLSLTSAQKERIFFRNALQLLDFVKLS